MSRSARLSLPPDSVAPDDPASGLSAVEAARRLSVSGPNELWAPPGPSVVRRLGRQVSEPLTVLLLAATVISLWVWRTEGRGGPPYESLTILAIVIMNAALSWSHERRAERAVAALKVLSAPGARVYRGGQLLQIPARNVVPGDRLLLEEGDRVCADARLVSSVSLQVMEAALTGESTPVSKDAEHTSTSAEERRSLVFAGTVVTGGRGQAVVEATGMRTELGRIADLLGHLPDALTPLEQELRRLARTLTVGVLVAAVMTSTALTLLSADRSPAHLLSILVFAVALAVAAVPEGLPAITSVVLALATRRMAQRHVVVRQLPAVEALGAVTVIASDKTGTLTCNQMTVRTVQTATGISHLGGTGYDPTGTLTSGSGPLPDTLRTELEQVLRVACLANNAEIRNTSGEWEVQGDPTEGALLVAATKAAVNVTATRRLYPRLGELPFSSERRLMSTLNAAETGLLLCTKGAPDTLLARCQQEMRAGQPIMLSEQRRRELHAACDALGGMGLRTLGVAQRPLARGEWAGGTVPVSLEDQLTFLGLLALHDPPRPGARDAVARARRAGIRTLLITGDHPVTALSIARALGLDVGQPAVLTGADLEGMTPEALTRAAQHITVYARVNPTHKLRIVRALQRAGERVAMTGDGVNDAPALKAADVGVAMGRGGTDVAREASDLVLTDDNYASIVAAVEEGRTIYRNIRTFLRYLLSSNLGEVLTIFGGVTLAVPLGLRGDPGQVALPLLATHLLWINLVSDGAPALALGLAQTDPDIMTQAPRRPTESILTPVMWRGVGVVAALTAVSALAVLDAALPGGWIPGSGTLPYARTMVFTTLMFTSIFNVLNARSETRSAVHDLCRNRWVWGAMLLSLALHVVVVNVPMLQRAFSCVPLSGLDWLQCAGAGSIVLWGREIDKFQGRLRTRRRATSPSN